MKRGFTLVRREPGLWVSTRAMLLNTLLAAPFIALVPAMAKKALNGDEKTVALLTTCQGIGAVAGALTVAALTKRFGGRRLLVGLMTAMPVGLILYGAGASVGTAGAAVGVAIMGGLYMMALITFSSVAQTRAPASLRGRAVSVNTTILGIVYPIGALLEGALGDRIGVDRATIAAGTLFGLIILAVRLLRPTFTAPLDSEAVAA